MECSFNNCYYFTAIGTPQGKKARKITAQTYDNVRSVTLENAGTPATEYTYSGITAYSTGIKYNNVFYAGNDDVVSLTLTPTESGYAVSAVQAVGGTLSGADNPYSLTLDNNTDDYVTITAYLQLGYKVSVNNVVSGENTLLGFTTDRSTAIYTEGEDVTLTVQKASNVTLNSIILIPDSDPTDISMAEGIGNSQYYFEMPASNVTVTYDYYMHNNGQNAYDISWFGGTGIKMLKQVNGINVSNANAGDVVTITLSDEEKRRATNVTVKGVTSNNSVDNVTRASIQDNTFTFTMPSEAVKVTADFKSAIYMMTAGHCTINASVEDGESTYVDGLVGVLAADQGKLVTLNVTPTVAGEAISRVALRYTPIGGGENVSAYATKESATSFTFTMPDAVTVTLLPESVFALADGADNSSILGVHNGETIDVMLQNRTLIRDGKWNTLCLPFEVTISDTHPFAGATVMLLDNRGEHVSENVTHHTGFDAESSTLYLYFKAPETTGTDVVIPAGMPFIIKWEGQYESDIVDPIIYNVAIDNVEPLQIHFKGGKFVGSYSPISITAEDRSVLFLGDNNTLYYPDGTTPTTIGAFRSYFQLGGIEDGDTTNPQSEDVRAFVLNFGEESTGVSTPLHYREGQGGGSSWYTLDGRRISSKPTTPGLYIHGNKKLYVK